MKTITGLLIAAAVSVALASGIARSAYAADSCTWILQPSGKYWGECVDDKAKVKCYLCPVKDNTDAACVPASCS